MAKTNFEKMATEIIEWCKANGLWQDTAIYFGGKAWATWNSWGYRGEEIGKEIAEGVFEYSDKNPLDYFEYANPDTLSMGFEGPLYDVLNTYVGGWVKLEEELLAIFKKHGYYYEMGNAWNLSACED